MVDTDSRSTTPDDLDAGGAVDITEELRDELLAAGRDGTDRAVASMATTLAPSAHHFQIGDAVVAGDYDNIGEVIGVDGEKATLRFVNKRTGATATAFFPLAALSPLRSSAAARPIRILSLKQILELPKLQWLVADMLPLGTLAVLFGDPGAGKSFVALDLALHVATGEHWLGRATMTGPVIYIAAEGLFGLPLRIRAWLKDRAQPLDETLKENFTAIGDAVAIPDPKARGKLLEAIETMARKPVLVIVDTLARCMAGFDENSAEDMGLLVAGCDEIRAETGATVLLVHHTTKGQRTERGSSALRGGADTMFSVAADEGSASRIVLKVEKQKEGLRAEPLTFDLVPVSLDLPGEESPGSSCRLSMVHQPSNVPSNVVLARNPRRILMVVQYELAAEGATLATIGKVTGIKRSTLYHAIKKVLEMEYVECFERNGEKVYRLTTKGKLLASNLSNA
jgi:hypothetical protein